MRTVSSMRVSGRAISRSGGDDSAMNLEAGQVKFSLKKPVVFLDSCFRRNDKSSVCLFSFMRCIFSRVFGFVRLVFRMRMDIKNLSKIIILPFALTFSLSTFAEFMFSCGDVNQQSYNEYKTLVYQNDPGNVRKVFSMAMEAICVGKMDEGITLLERSSDGGHVVGSHRMGDYYRTDKTFDVNSITTSDPENFTAALFYYQRAAAQIKSNSQYPEGTYRNIPYLEEHNQHSAKIFIRIPYMYYRGYLNALKDMLDNVDRVEYIDTLEALEKMKQSSDQCLQRPSLPVWKERADHVYNTMRVRCQALRDFSIQVYPLENERITIAKGCVGSLTDCPEHSNILDNQIVPVMMQMLEIYNSVSL